MRSRLLLACVTLPFALLLACSDDKGSSTSSSSSSSSSGGSSSSSGSSGAAAPGDDAGGSAEPGPKPGPKLTGVMKMAGSLHVSWDLPDDCDAVELERKDGDGGFEVVYELPASADNKHDGAATADMLYTYRVRCAVGAAYTEYSNEMGANPSK